MTFLEKLKTFIKIAVSKINMPIALFGKVEQPTYNIEKLELHYHEAQPTRKQRRKWKNRKRKQKNRKTKP